MELSRNTIEPLYYQIRENIRNMITNNDYPPNSMIPSEAELCNIYGVSRITVRRDTSGERLRIADAVKNIRKGVKFLTPG